VVTLIKGCRHSVRQGAVRLTKSRPDWLVGLIGGEISGVVSGSVKGMYGMQCRFGSFIRLLNLPELPQAVNGDVNTFLLHALLAIPFLAGIHALRNMIKTARRLAAN
jgi:hypothetical protein